MFKKIEIWILYLTFLSSIVLAVGFGVLVRQELVGGVKAGWISETALFLAEIPANLNRLISNVDDLQVEDRFTSLDGFDGTPNTQESYLLLTRYDGDLQEGIVELIDLTNFTVLHTWNPDIDKFNNLVEQVDEFRYLERDYNNARSRIFHPKLTNDGGLVFHGNFTPLIKIDACSNLIFTNTHDVFHHSIETDINGNIWVSSLMYPQTLPAEKVGREIKEFNLNYRDDAIVKLSSDGEILFEKSVSQIFIDNGLEYLLFSVGDYNHFTKDPIHINDIQPVDFDGGYWNKGDVFLSLRHQSMVLLYRPSTNAIIWQGTGPYFHQHDVDILDDHRISVFNNNSKNFVDGDVVDGINEVIIYDFETNEYSSYLQESLLEHDVRTITEGISEIMPNGDMFIEESNYVRTLYFNADGSLRWSYVNRADNGNVYRLNWSRILYNQEDLRTVNNFLNSKITCDE